jgi:hypothetical protein
MAFIALTEVTNTSSLANIVTRPIFVDLSKAVAVHREGTRFSRIRFSGDIKDSIDVLETLAEIQAKHSTQLKDVPGGVSIPGYSTKDGEVSNPPVESGS